MTGNDGKPLRIPSDLDDSLCQYQSLAPALRSKFDRALFWLDLAARQWTIAMSASFASLVTAVESLTNRGLCHRVYCDVCKATTTHDAPGATENFRSFFETFAPGEVLRKDRNLMYKLRSGILHGSGLMQLDQNLAFGWDPPWWNEYELNRELWRVLRLAMRNWLRNALSQQAATSAT